MPRPSYIAVSDGFGEYICSPSKIPAYEERCDIYREENGTRTLVYTPSFGWLSERPADEELCGIESFFVPTSDPSEVARLIALSLDDPDAARAEVATVNGG